MIGKLPNPIIVLLVLVAYLAATVAAAASPVARCPALESASHLGQPHHHSSESHHDHSGSKPGECLKCCLGACLVTVSLPAPTNGTSSPAFFGTPVVYPSEDSIL